nr:hypothetical protein [Tanacetum cinerariifolium]
MVAILEKGEFNSDFHPMVDFITASPLRIEIIDEGTHILATVDGIQRTVSESSLRRNLKLRDEDGIVSIPDTELFENLTLMGQYSRRARIAQSSILPTIADEPASPVRDVSEGEACPIESGFIADQDRATIAKSSTLPYDSAPRVTSPAADEGKAKEDVPVKQSKDDAPIKGRSINEGEAATERIIGPTASPIATRRNGKEVMVESDTPKKKKLQEQIDAQVARELEEQQEKENMRMNEQIARDAEVARIHVEEEIQGMIDSLDKSNETIAKYLQEYQDFASEEDLNQLWALVKEYLSIRPAISEKEMELWVELKRMYEPDPEDQMWTLTQNFMHAPVEWKLYDLSGVHHVTTKDKEIFMLVEKDYPFRKGLALVMISYKLQVENYSKMAEDLIRKIYNIAKSPRQQGD